MTRAEKSFASAKRCAAGFWRLHGRSPLTGKIISGSLGGRPPGPSPVPLQTKIELPGDSNGASVNSTLPAAASPSAVGNFNPANV